MALLVAFLMVFPGRQAPMALSLATGIGTASLQARVDRLEEQAILGKDLTEADKAFLRDLYTCMAKGGKLIVVARQSGAMMDRYLEASGEDLRTAPRIFLGSRRVQYEMTLMKRWMQREAAQPGGLQETYVSRTFHMADPEFFESLVGLHYGRLIAKPRHQQDGTLSIRWRAEVPWHWPPYEYLQRRYGNYHAWCFPVPNARSLLFGKKHCLWIDDGLGNHLAELGLAKPFLVYSEWNESQTSPRPITPLARGLSKLCRSGLSVSWETGGQHIDSSRSERASDGTGESWFEIKSAFRVRGPSEAGHCTAEHGAARCGPDRTGPAGRVLGRAGKRPHWSRIRWLAFC